MPSSKPAVFVLVAFALIALAAYAFKSPHSIESKSPCPAGAPSQQVEVRARKFAFEPDPIVLNAGSCVTFHLTSQDVPHGFAVSALGINEQAFPGEVTTFVFYADPSQKGTYEAYCSIPCGSGHGGMRGTLAIE